MPEISDLYSFGQELRKTRRKEAKNTDETSDHIDPERLGDQDIASRTDVQTTSQKTPVVKWPSSKNTLQTTKEKGKDQVKICYV